MKNLKLFWIDDMVDWVVSAQKNLEIIARKRGVNLINRHAINGEDHNINQILDFYDWDGIIMDYHMEPQNGDFYIRKIREVDHLESVPIVFYSQDNSLDLESLITSQINITTVFRPNLDDVLIKLFLDHSS